MREIICPIDDRPCDPECKDRFVDVPEGGCLLTMLLGLNENILIMKQLLGADKKTALDAANTQDGKAEME